MSWLVDKVLLSIHGGQSDVQAEIQRLVKEKDQAKQEKEQAILEIAKLQTDMEQLTKAVNDMTTQLENKKKEQQKLEREKQNVKDELRALQKEKNEIQHENEGQLKEWERKLQDHQRQHQEKISDLELKNTRAQQERDAGLEELQSSHRKKLEDIRIQHQKEMDEFQAKLSHEQEKAGKARMEEETSLREMIEKLQIENEEQAAKIPQLQAIKKKYEDEKLAVERRDKELKDLAEAERKSLKRLHISSLLNLVPPALLTSVPSTSQEQNTSELNKEKKEEQTTDSYNKNSVSSKESSSSSYSSLSSSQSTSATATATASTAMPQKPDPWQFVNTDSDELHRLFEGKSRVFVVGPFKVGKTFVINSVSDGPGSDIDTPPMHYGHEVKNTHGICFHEKTVENQPVLLVDTEGFFQPAADLSPAMKEDFIVSFMQRTADILLLVLSRVSTHDIPVIRRITNWWMSNPFGNMAILHNVRDISTEENLEQYIEQLSPVLQLEPHIATAGPTGNGATKWIRQQKLPFSAKGALAIINHCFIGDAFLLREPTRAVFKHLRSSIHASKYRSLDFKMLLTDSIRYVVGKYFIVPTGHGNAVEVCISKHSISCPIIANLPPNIGVAGSKFDTRLSWTWFVEPDLLDKDMSTFPKLEYKYKIAQDQPDGSTILTEFDPVKYRAKNPIVHILIDSGGITVSENNVTPFFKGANQQVSVQIKRKARIGGAEMAYEPCVEDFDVPFPVNLTPSSAEFTANNVIFDNKTNLLFFPVLLNMNRNDFKDQLKQSVAQK